MLRHISRLLVPRNLRNMVHDSWVIDGSLPFGSSLVSTLTRAKRDALVNALLIWCFSFAYLVN